MDKEPRVDRSCGRSVAVLYNTKRPHQGRAMKGRTPLKVFTDGLPKKENAKMKPTPKAA